MHDHEIQRKLLPLLAATGDSQDARLVLNKLVLLTSTGPPISERRRKSFDKRLEVRVRVI